jgi:hypothetical protein
MTKDINIKERANNKIWSKIVMANIHLDDLKKEFKEKSYSPLIEEEQMQSLIDGQRIELKVLNYIYKLIELDNEDRPI